MSKETEQPKADNPQPVTQQIVAVPLALFQQTVEVLQNELPMAKARKVVLGLESCRVLSLGAAPAPAKEGETDDDGTTPA